MEDIERVTPAQIESCRKKFSELSANAGLCPEDHERVKSDSLWIRRFIAAQDGDPDKAAKMLFETCQWRKEFGVNELDHTKISQAMIKNGTLFIHNKDKWGKDLLTFKAKTHTKGVYDMEEVKKFIVYWFERIERFTKSDQISIIFDMKDTGWSNMDMDFIRYLIKLLKEYYPYFINYLIIYDMPWILKSAWSIIQTLLDKKSVERIKFVDKKSISEYIDAQNSLVEWGGTATYTYSFEPEVRVKNRRKSSLKALSINNNISSGDESSPEGKARHVQFTDRDGTTDIHSFDVLPNAPSPPQPRQRGPPRPSPTTDMSPREERSSPASPAQVAQLIEVPDTFMIEYSGGELSGDINIRNLTKELVIFKVKTTAPDSYRVKPTIGILDGGAEASANVAPNGRVNVREHRFQILAAVLPKDIDIASDESDNGRLMDFQSLNHIWKTSIQGQVPLYSKRIQCTFEGHAEEQRSGLASPGTVTMSQDDMRKGLVDLEKKISANVHEMLEEVVKKQQKMLYILGGLVLFFGVLTFFLIPSGCVQFNGSSCSGGASQSGSMSGSLSGSMSGSASIDSGPFPPPVPGQPDIPPSTPPGDEGGQGIYRSDPPAQHRSACLAS